MSKYFLGVIVFILGINVIVLLLDYKISINIYNASGSQLKLWSQPSKSPPTIITS